MYEVDGTAPNVCSAILAAGLSGALNDPAANLTVLAPLDGAWPAALTELNTNAATLLADK